MKENIEELIRLEENNLIYKGKTFVIPISWKEVSIPYLYGYIDAILKGVEINEVSQYILVYATSIEMPKKLKKKDKSDFLDTIGKASDLLSFFLQENELNFGILPEVIGLTTPERMLTKFTALEFIEANNYMRLFANTNKAKYLNKLCAILLRGKSQGKRLEYSESSFDYSLQKMNEISTPIKLAVMKMYEGEFYQLTKRYPKVFEGKGGEDNFPYSFITSLAGDKFGTTKQVEKENIHVLLNYIQMQIVELEKNK